MASNSDKPILIRTVDEKLVDIDSSLYESYFKNLVSTTPKTDDTTPNNEVISLPGIKSDTLKLCLSWLNQAKVAGARTEEFQLFDWEKELFEPLDASALCSLVHAAEMLGLESLIEVLSAILASKIHGKSVEKVREMFGIVCDIPQAELERIQKENEWIEQADLDSD